ncbi:potassium channel protein [Sphingomonas koreensis]|nr:potassium channel protein [Sphingomonas koreensis]
MPRARRRQTVQLGGVPAYKTGAPSRFTDLYYWVMEMSWPAFIAIASLLFVAINLVFGLVYAALPGAIANAAPGSIVDGFFFSVDTLGTVGYGAMAPATHLGHAIASVEILLGLFFSATMTGLIFARFARPRTSLAFSKVAVVGRYEGKPALMMRLASVRSRPLTDATAQMSWLETVTMPDGRIFRRLTELPLVRNRNAMLGLAWTLVHVLDEDSAVLAAHAGTERFMLAVTVGGVDTLLASQSQGGMRYRREDILIDHEFVDAILEEDGAMHLDLALLDDTVPINGPDDPA